MFVSSRRGSPQRGNGKSRKEREDKIAQAKKTLDDYKAGIAEREAKLDKEQADRIAAADKAVKEFEASIPQKVSEWAKANSTDSSWEVINPIGFNTSNGSKLELENDSSLFASGKNGISNYRIFATTAIDNITGVRIEAIPDQRLPKGGPGRAGDGNFVLTEFDVHASAVQKKEDWNVVKLWTFDNGADGWENQTKPNSPWIKVSLRLIAKAMTRRYCSIECTSRNLYGGSKG